MGGTPIQHASGASSDLEFQVVGGAPRATRLLPGDLWTFGRSPECSETLTIPALSRVALVIQHLDQGTVRVVSRQRSTGRVLLAADDLSESHVLGRGSSPVHLSHGNYTLKVELPPVVLRMELAVPGARRESDLAASRAHGAGVKDLTREAWVPQPGEPEEHAWIAVAALAVVASRYPEVVTPGDQSAGTARRSDGLRAAAAAWCGRSSTYWINERLKEAAEAADLQVPDRGERLSVVVSHYAQFFPDATIRAVRDELRQLLQGSRMAP
jgi:hypothetical protein